MNPFKSLKFQLGALFLIFILGLTFSSYVLSISAQKARESTELINILGRQKVLAMGMGREVNKFTSGKTLLDMIKRNILVLDEYISSMRFVYTREVFGDGGNSSSPHNPDLPLPATFTRMVNESLGKKYDFSMDIISEKPANPQKSLRSALDLKANEFFKNPEKNLFEEITEKGDLISFNYYSADRATEKSCITCHEKYRNDSIKLGDTLGIRTYQLSFNSNIFSGKMEVKPGLKGYEGYRDIFLKTLNVLENGDPPPIF